MVHVQCAEVNACLVICNSHYKEHLSILIDTLISNTLPTACRHHLMIPNAQLVATSSYNWSLQYVIRTQARTRTIGETRARATVHLLARMT